MTDRSDADATLFAKCLDAVKGVAEEFPDTRKGKNCTLTIPDAAMSAFSVFFFQSPSWLASQRAMQDDTGKNNAQTIFGIGRIGSDNRIRGLLDLASPDLLHAAYWELLGILENSGALKRFQVLGDHMLVALDGTDFYSSEKISCPNCLVARHKTGRTTFSHKAVTPTIVSPNVRQAVPLRPEFVAPQDGAIKQDCEINASKRWIECTTDWLREKKPSYLVMIFTHTYRFAEKSCSTAYTLFSPAYENPTRPHTSGWTFWSPVTSKRYPKRVEIPTSENAHGLCASPRTCQ